jgi:metallo-beta-lactamase family protein
MLDGEKTIRLFGLEVPVRCQVKVVNGLSAHADQLELLRWLSGFKQSPKFTFITHGEPEAAKTFSKTINEKLGWESIVPEYLESVNLFEGI